MITEGMGLDERIQKSHKYKKTIWDFYIKYDHEKPNEMNGEKQSKHKTTKELGRKSYQFREMS